MEVRCSEHGTHIDHQLEIAWIKITTHYHSQEISRDLNPYTLHPYPKP